MLKRFAPAQQLDPSPGVVPVIAGIVRLLKGAAVDLGWIDLDLSGIAPFPRRVYDVTRTIPAGSTLSYGEIAARLGQPAEARLVGDALAKNPFPIVVPCHRVLAADGRLGGFSAAGGVMTKLRLLSIERVQAPGTLPLFEPPA
jgi:methylated-DNA-[protein]-cysteine S-methyltransferase